MDILQFEWLGRSAAIRLGAIPIVTHLLGSKDVPVARSLGAPFAIVATSIDCSQWRTRNPFKTTCKESLNAFAPLS